MRTLAFIVQAEVWQELGQLDTASRLLDAAMGGEDATLDLLLALASQAIAEQRFGQGNEFYDAAILRFGDEVVEPRLLREVPGNLLWRWARQLAVTDRTRALSALDQALERGINGMGEFPAKRAMAEKAQLLEDLGRRDEAALTYHSAGDQYARSGSPKAVGLFEKACELAPGVAKYHWSLGDALRLQAADTTAVVNLDAMEKARQVLEAGFALEAPGRKHAWALASYALVLDSFDDADDPAVQIERALLLDPDYMIGFWLLSTLLRKRGFVDEALAAAGEAYRRDDDDFRSVGQLDLALRDRGDLTAALQVIDGYLDRGGNDPEALVYKSGLLLRLNQPDRALESLTGAPVESASIVYRRATAHDLLGHDSDARRCFEDLWNRREDLGNAAIAAWSGYRLGLLDEAADMFTELAARSTLAPPALFDLYLAQVRLVRGDQERDDVAAGERILTAAIERTNIVDDLQWLIQEFAFIRRDISGKPHEGSVLPILAVAADLVDDRCAFLRGSHRDPGSLAVRLASARIALASKQQFDVAFGRYLDLVRQGDPPEARLGMIAAMQLLLDQGDQLLRAGGLPAARAEWEPLSAALTLLPPEEPVCQALQARLGLAALEQNGQADEEASTLLGACTEQAIAAALQIFARNVPTLWAHHDGLSAMAAQDTRSAAERARFSAAAAGVPLDSIYALSQGLATASAALPVVSPIEITVGAAHRGLVDSDEITLGIRRVRDRLTDETGLQLPGVGVRYAVGGSPDVIEYLIYERTVARVTVAAEPQDAQGVAGLVLAHFERAVRDNLFRLISVDDVDLWRQGWNVLQAPGWESVRTATDEFSRLRLARLLRMLLREGLPISDRNSILAGFAEAEDSGRSDAMDALGIIRRRLYPAILGPDRDVRIHALPDPLEARIAAGLSPATSNQWELDRSVAASLANDLRQWCAEQAQPGPVVVQVASRRTRPIAWHLLAAVRPRIYIVATEELP